jgi:hypothetical protein
MKTINKYEDLIVVVDVTSLPNSPDLDFSFEKCKNPKVK